MILGRGYEVKAFESGLEARLVSRGVIAQEALHEARQAALDSQRPLIVELIDHRGIAEDAIAAVLETDCGACVPLAGESVDLEALRTVAHPTAEKFRVLPLSIAEHSGRRFMRLAMANPLDREAVESIEADTDCVIEPVLALSSDIKKGIERHYRGLVTKLIPRAAGENPDARSSKRRRFGEFGGAKLGGAEGQSGESSGGTSDEDWRALAPTPEQRVRALCNALFGKGILKPEEYMTALREILERERNEV